VNDQNLAELGELESLRRTVLRLSPSVHAIVGSGDDSAVIVADQSFVVSTDTLIENHDFKLDWSSSFDLGYKAVATNLADIAAMGAKPTALVVALVVPSSTKISWLEGFADGLDAACRQLAPGAGVVGGDLASGEQIVVSVTVHGSMEGRSPVLRSGAKAGDVVAVAGTLGKSSCGLALLQSGNKDLINSYDDWVSYHLRPEPPIQQGVEAAIAGATSMLDVSDGLSQDLIRICKASEVAIELSSKELQGFEAMLELPALGLGVDAKSWVLHGGEDHALVATFPKDAVLPKAFKAIGVVTSGEAELYLDGVPLQAKGWDSITGK
jgi:thiamine-monophosphate kinase